MTDSQDLLFELGTEELPPKSLLTLSLALRDNFASRLQKAGLEHSAIKAYATPRRLAVLIEDLATSQPDSVTEKRGPALQAAYGDDGAPTKAAAGFAGSCGVTVDQLGTLKTDKGEWLCFTRKAKGAAAAELLPGIVWESLAALPIARRMRWGNCSAEFVRPVHWAVLLFGDQMIKTEILGVESDNLTYGHRFHAPEAITLESPADYPSALYSQGKVMVDFEQRQNKIEQQAADSATRIGGQAHIEADLLEEITALVEWPVPVVGKFDERFLSLPPEVLITTMQSNQKYFPVKDENGNLLPYFITISNIESKNPAAVKSGNERVILPRLSDAEFFWAQDRKKTLESRVVSLNHIIFQKKLGTLADKTHRVEGLAQSISENLSINPASAKHASILAKTDLLTEMVGEFPSLQGIMGRYYALADGESEEVAAAIEEQYLPKQAGGALPASQTGMILSLAEKLDTLTGIFSAGLIPSGDKDPYALRRAAIGVIRLITEKKLDLDLLPLLQFAIQGLPHDFDHAATVSAVFAFILERLKGYCLDRGYKPDEFESVRSLGTDNLLDFELRLEAVKAFRKLPEAESLAAANKRIHNILKKAETEQTDQVKEALLTATEEQDLWRQTNAAAEAVWPMLDQRDYTKALQRLAILREPVDQFFDTVMVMTEDPALRHNRLVLLGNMEKLFRQIANISKLQS